MAETHNWWVGAAGITWRQFKLFVCSTMAMIMGSGFMRLRAANRYQQRSLLCYSCFLIEVFFFFPMDASRSRLIGNGYLLF